MIAAAIPIALALSEFVPQIVRWVTGSRKAEEVAGAVVDIAREVTGADDDAAMVKALRANPELAMQFKMKVLDQETRFEELYYQDKADARARDVEFVRAGRVNWRANIMLALAFAAVIAIAAILASFPEMSEAVVGALVLMIGSFVRDIGTAFDFEFGSSRGSSEKTDVIASMIRQRGAGR